MIDSGIQGLYTSSASAQRLNICNTGGFYPNQNEGNNFVRDRGIFHIQGHGQDQGQGQGQDQYQRSGSGSMLGSGSVLGSGSKMALNQDQKDEEMIMILNKTKDALIEQFV